MNTAINLSPSERIDLALKAKETLPLMFAELSRVDRAKKKGRTTDMRSIMNQIKSLNAFLVQLAA